MNQLQVPSYKLQVSCESQVASYKDLASYRLQAVTSYSQVTGCEELWGLGWKVFSFTQAGDETIKDFSDLFTLL